MTTADTQFMQRALELASQGSFSTAPNPRVGCVLVKDNQIIAEGWHQKTGSDHAEILALKAATASVVGATCYVTLEPCSHQGKTPPCADALIEAGISRLVIAMEDPNPQVAGQGIARLRQAGLRVELGVLEAQARQLNQGFIKRMTQGLPWVTLKLAMSLDGKTAMASGESQWITGAQSRSRVQRLRAQSSAVITGSQTLRRDNARLTVRPEQLPVDERAWSMYQPLRLVLNRSADLDTDLAFFNQESDALWVTSQSAPNHQKAGVAQLRLPDSGTGLDLQALVEWLGSQGHNEVLVEAGAELSGAFLSQDLVDELVIFMAPILLGDAARGLVKLPGLDHLEQALRFENTSISTSGDDLEMHFKRRA